MTPIWEGEDKDITFQIGHLLEDVVAQIFAKKTGFTVYEDHMMYQHPIFPFMLADVDRFIMLPDGTKAILECKTAHPDMKFVWANDAVPWHYELQVRHYMAVMNIDVAYIACLFSNRESDFVWRKIERDLEEEENNILQLQDFWAYYVMARVEPPLVEKPDLVLDVLQRYYGPADKSAPVVQFDKQYAAVLEQIFKLRAEKADLDARSRALDARVKALYSPLVEEMGAACNARCVSGTEEYQISFSPQYRTGVSKDNLSVLKAQYPDIYDDLVETTETRVFKVTKRVSA